MRRALQFALIVFVVCLPLSGAAAEKVALVIGNGAYQRVLKLDNTVNDAKGIANSLTSIGFKVTTLFNASGEQMRQALSDFAFRSETADLALIYFAGHGVEVQGQNFLIPVDANVHSNRDIQQQAVSLNQMLHAVDHARKMRIVILDSCRNNPFGDTLDNAASQPSTQSADGTGSADGSGRAGRGLAPPSPERGTLVAFAARDGQVALDGDGLHSPFAQALMDNLPRKGLEISLMFRQVRDEVLHETNNQQEPHTYGSLPGTPFYVAGPAGADSQVADANPKVAWSDIRPDQESRLASLANKGDTRSMVGLAYMRLNSEDSRYNPSAAARLLAKAADGGSAEAEYELGKLYETGLGVPQMVQHAMELYMKAAAQDYPDALNDLGFIYYQGALGTARDPARALDFFRRAADLRQPEAMFNYAALIDDGKVPGKGPQDAALYLYRSLRTGSQQVFDLLRKRPTMFKLATRKALQTQLAEHSLYSGPIDGDLGPATQESLRKAYGLDG